MFEGFAIITSLAIYKIASLAVGLGFAYMGYKLFIAGIWGNAGDLQAKYGDNKLVLKSAAPGTFFALFGTIIIAVTIWKDIDLTHRTNLPKASDYLKESAEDKPPPVPPF